MASLTKITKTCRLNKAKKAGRDRKNRLNRDGTTPTKEKVFGGPAKPAPRA